MEFCPVTRNLLFPILESSVLSGDDWVDEYLLGGGDDAVYAVFDEPITRRALREQVSARTVELRAAGLRPGAAISLRLPPGPAFAVNLLAAWRTGAQVSLLDHRLTPHEVDQVLTRIAPQLVVSAPGTSGRVPRGYTDVVPVVTPYPGRPAETGHALLQLSSGSTGTSKVIGRTAADLIAEIDRYGQIDGIPRAGERVVLLASMVHVLGLVGGLLYGLHTGVQLAWPRFLSTEALFDAAAADPAPTTVLGVPFHLRLLVASERVAQLPQLKHVIVGGEPVPPHVRESFAQRYRVPLGNMYGMTEAGVIATDLFGRHRPALEPAPGMALREESGQLLLAMKESPYIGPGQADRWAQGWLRTGDAGIVDAATGLLTVLGRGDSQVSIGGLKVDLTEVEQTLAALPGVAGAVVVYESVIEAFVVLDTPDVLAGLRDALAARLAPYKIPRRVNVVAELPSTTNGKRVRNAVVLQAAADRNRTPLTKETVPDVR
jgi:3-hydroxy-4-methylanthranilate adenylyltransferase